MRVPVAPPVVEATDPGCRRERRRHPSTTTPVERPAEREAPVDAAPAPEAEPERAPRRGRRHAGRRGRRRERRRRLARRERVVRSTALGSRGPRGDRATMPRSGSPRPRAERPEVVDIDVEIESTSRSTSSRPPTRCCSRRATTPSPTPRTRCRVGPSAPSRTSRTTFSTASAASAARSTPPRCCRRSTTSSPGGPTCSNPRVDRAYAVGAASAGATADRAPAPVLGRAGRCGREPVARAAGVVAGEHRRAHARRHRDRDRATPGCPVPRMALAAPRSRCSAT